MKSNGRTLLAAACCLIVILSAGCAALSPMTAEEESRALEERVKSYMQAVSERKWDRAYAFLDSSSRETMARDSYLIRTRKLPYKGYTIAEIKVHPSADRASVIINVDISKMGYKFKGVSQLQHWVKEKGEWLLKIEPPSRTNPFTMPEKQK